MWPSGSAAHALVALIASVIVLGIGLGAVMLGLVRPAMFLPPPD